MKFNFPSAAVPFIATYLAALAACQSISPSSPSQQFTFRSETGCGISQYNHQFVMTYVKSMSWSGECSGGLASGIGTLKINLNSGLNLTYSGEMSKGFINGKGKLVSNAGWVRQGVFSEGNLIFGSIYRPDGKLVFKGYLATAGTDPSGNNITLSAQRFDSGRYCLNDIENTCIDNAKFDLSGGFYSGRGGIDPETGKGFIWGQVFKNGKLAYLYIEGRRINSFDAYLSSRLALSERTRAQQQREIEAMQRAGEEYMAAQKRKNDQELLSTLEMLASVSEIAASRKSAPLNSQQTVNLESISRRTLSEDAASSTNSRNGKAGNKLVAHDPLGEANSCIRPNINKRNGGFTNVCGFAVSYIHCLAGLEKDLGDSWAFHCDRSEGLWAKGTTPAGLGAGRTDYTSIPPNARVFWIACREPYSISNARFNGERIVASCVKW